MESVQQYSARVMLKWDTNQNGIIQLHPNLLERNTETTKASRKNMDFLDSAANTYFPSFAERWSVQNAVANRVDTNKDGMVSTFEKVKAWFKFGSLT